MSKLNVRFLTALALLVTGSIGLATAAAAAAADGTSTETIVQIASSDPDLSTLVTALSAADLVKTLEGPGPFTVFAPTNEAFGKLPKGILDFLLANTAVLKTVLLYHVSTSKHLVPGSLTTVAGEKVFPSFSYDSKGLTLTVNNSMVTVTPIEASNGEIYIIDSVLLPQF
jgi:uncharacterized surface protein with fasciclin (FAS1) repeats